MRIRGTGLLLAAAAVAAVVYWRAKNADESEWDEDDGEDDGIVLADDSEPMTSAVEAGPEVSAD